MFPPAGTNFIIPKVCGDILMTSDFQSREYGLEFGELLTLGTIELINIKRRGGKYRAA